MKSYGSYEPDPSTAGAADVAIKDATKTLVLAHEGEGVYTVTSADVLKFAGDYTVSLEVKVGDVVFTPASTNLTGDALPTHKVYSVKPNAKITSVLPKGTFETHPSSGHNASGNTPEFNDTSATVYYKCTINSIGGCDSSAYDNLARPSVEIAIAGMGYATEAKLDFGGGVYDGNTQVGAYVWTSDGKLNRNIGAYESKTLADDKKTPAGTITANQLILTADNVAYSFDISTITINNPY
jgi:hypothetical protein